jgi:hypothetical protein
MKTAIGSILALVLMTAGPAAAQWYSPGDYSASGSDAGATLPGAAPGTDFTVDLTVSGLGPSETVPVALAIDFRTTPGADFDSLKLSLPETGAVLTIPAWQTGQSAHLFYDPGSYFEPLPTNCTSSLLDGDLRAALADGVLDGTLWVEGASFAGTETWQLDSAVLIAAHTPEPGTMVLLALGGVALIARKRRT